MRESRAKDKPISFRALFGEAVVQQEMLLFVMVSAMDVFMTYIMIRQKGGQFVEANPIARYFIDGWGVKGMVNFKFGIVAFVCVLSQIIARRRPLFARWILLGATALTAVVVAYSLMLFLQNFEAPSVELSAL